MPTIYGNYSVEVEAFSKRFFVKTKIGDKEKSLPIRQKTTIVMLRHNETRDEVHFRFWQSGKKSTMRDSRVKRNDGKVPFDEVIEDCSRMLRLSKEDAERLFTESVEAEDE